MALDHPCFECKLPDCDETDRGCNLRRALAEYRRFGKSATDRIRARSNIAYNELYGVDRNSRRKISRDKIKEGASA